MTIFGESRLGRVGYIIACLLMLAFDFAKQPVERYLVAMHDEVADKLLEPRPAKFEDLQEAGRINGKEMPFMLKGHEDAIRSIVNSPTKLSKAEIEERLRNAVNNTPLTFVPNRPIDPEIKQLAATRSSLEMAFPVAVLVMTGITIIGLLWMVSSRLRDIGWPQFYLWILLAPIFVPKFLGLPMPALLLQGISLLFYAAVFGLALIPGEGSRPTAPPLRMQAAEVPGRKTSGQFGKLGTR